MRLRFTAKCEGCLGVIGGLVAGGWWLGAPDGAAGIEVGIVGACGAGLSVSVPASVPADNESNGMLFPMTPSSAPAPDGAAGTETWAEPGFPLKRWKR